jgi:hypothetical protein
MRIPPIIDTSRAIPTIARAIVALDGVAALERRENPANFCILSPDDEVYHPLNLRLTQPFVSVAISYEVLRHDLRTQYHMKVVPQRPRFRSFDISSVPEAAVGCAYAYDPQNWLVSPRTPSELLLL